MSADNGIYIGSFPTIDGKIVYRVPEANAIENCQEVENYPTELTRAYQSLYFSKSKEYTTIDEALKEAHRIENEYVDNGDWTEYGICILNFDVPIMSIKEAQKIHDNYWNTTKLQDDYYDDMEKIYGGE